MVLNSFHRDVGPLLRRPAPCTVSPSAAPWFLLPGGSDPFAPLTMCLCKDAFEL